MRSFRYLLVIVVVVGATLSARTSYAGDDQTPPECVVVGVSPDTFYPRIDGYRDEASVQFTVSDDFAGDLSVRLQVLIPDSGGAFAYEGASFLVSNPGGGTVTWNGRDGDGVLAAEREYDVLVHVTDGNNNVNDCHHLFTLDHAKLVEKTFRKTATAAGPSKLYDDVGYCSTLRRPAARGWEGSLGYYSNTRCSHPNDFDDGLVMTINGVIVPEAFKGRYHSMVVKLYGGAATARPRSKGILQYLKANEDAAKLRVIGSSLGTHAGATVDDSKPFIRRDDFDQPYVAWAFATAEGHRYDVRDYTVVLKYTALA